MKHVSLDDDDETIDDENSKNDRLYFLEAEDNAQRSKWLAKPYRNVPEYLLPAIKASFLCYSQ